MTYTMHPTTNALELSYAVSGYDLCAVSARMVQGMRTPTAKLATRGVFAILKRNEGEDSFQFAKRILAASAAL
jgi:hypothetical protein